MSSEPKHEFDEGTIPGFGAQGASPEEHRFEGRPQPQRVVRGSEDNSDAATRPITLNDPNPAPDLERRSSEFAAVEAKATGKISFDERRADTEERAQRRGLRAFLTRILSGR